MSSKKKLYEQSKSCRVTLDITNIKRERLERNFHSFKRV